MRTPLTRIRRTLAAAVLGAALLSAPAAQAALYGNIVTPAMEFPLGALSFADELVSFSPGLLANSGGVIEPLPQYRNGLATLGVPDVVSIASFSLCNSGPSFCRFASLGYAGELVVRFTDNRLTGSGTTAKDLWIFEAGPSEPTFVDISPNGIDWYSVGTIDTPSNPSPGIDIDAFGFGPSQQFAYVRLRDDPNAGQPSGPTLGLDVDAIGALSSVPAPVPVPAAGWLLGSAIGLLGVLRRRR